MKTAIRFVCIFILSVLLFSGCTCGKVGVEQLNVTAKPEDRVVTSSAEEPTCWEVVEDQKTLHMLSAYCAGKTGYETMFGEDEAELYLRESGAYELSYSCFTDAGSAVILDRRDSGRSYGLYRAFRTYDFGRDWEQTGYDLFDVPYGLKEIVFLNGSFFGYGLSESNGLFYTVPFTDNMKNVPEVSYVKGAGSYGLFFKETEDSFWDPVSLGYDSNRELYFIEAEKYGYDDYAEYFDDIYNGTKTTVEPAETIRLLFTENGDFRDYSTLVRWEPAEERELRFLKAVSAGHAGYDTPFSADAAAVYLADFDNSEKYRYESEKQCFTPEGRAVVMRSVCSDAGQRYYRIDRTFDYGKTWEVYDQEPDFGGNVCDIYAFEDAFWACGCSSAAESFFVVRIGNGPREQAVQTFTAGRYITAGWDVKTLRYDAQSGLYELVLCRMGADGEESATATERFSPNGDSVKN